MKYLNHTKIVLLVLLKMLKNKRSQPFCLKQNTVIAMDFKEIYTKHYHNSCVAEQKNSRKTKTNEKGCILRWFNNNFCNISP